MYPPILRVHLKEKSVKDLPNDAYVMFLCFLYSPAWRMAYSYNLGHPSMCPPISVSVTFYSTVRVSSTPPTAFKVMV